METQVTAFISNARGDFRLQIAEGWIFEDAGQRLQSKTLKGKTIVLQKNLFGQWPWTRGPARFFWRVEWQDSTELDPTGDNFFEDRNGNIVSDTSARIINDAAFSYTFFDSVTAQISVDNVFNREASDLQLARSEFTVAHFDLDEIFGRQYRFRVSVQF